MPQYWWYATTSRMPDPGLRSRHMRLCTQTRGVSRPGIDPALQDLDKPLLGHTREPAE